MNAERKFLIQKVMKELDRTEDCDSASIGFERFKKHLEQFTDEEIKEELERIKLM